MNSNSKNNKISVAKDKKKVNFKTKNKKTITEENSPIYQRNCYDFNKTRLQKRSRNYCRNLP